MLRRSRFYMMFVASLLVQPLFADFSFTPPKEFTLDPKYIAIHHPVKTDQLAAQLYFDQGLTQLYAFNNDTAYWSFLKASQIDPQMAMAYWGMTLALAPNLHMHKAPEREKAAKEALQKALNISENSPEVEADYIKTLIKKYGDDSDDTDKRNTEYSQALGQLSKKYPDDPDAATLWAASLLDLEEKAWTLDGKPLGGTQEAVDVLEKTMKKYPNHVGANHYYIHVIDGSPYPEKGLEAAARLQKILPTSGHLLHMPSHIYLLVGDYHKATLSSEDALAADREYVNTYGMIGSYPFSYITHTLYFLTRAYSLEERFGNAKQAANELRQLYLADYQQMPKMEYLAVMPLFILVRFHDWQEVLKFPKPIEKMPLANLIWHFSRALAFANLNHPSEALKEKEQFEQGKEKVFGNELFQEEDTKKMVQILGYFIDAKIAENDSRFPDTIQLLQQAIKEQDTLPYNESPVWFFSSRQYLGSLLLRLKQYEDAEQIFREDLDIIPNNSRSLFGLKESLAAQSKTYALYWIDKSFQQSFKYSDINLTADNL